MSHTGGWYSKRTGTYTSGSKPTGSGYVRTSKGSSYFSRATYRSGRGSSSGGGGGRRISLAQFKAEQKRRKDAGQVLTGAGRWKYPKGHVLAGSESIKAGGKYYSRLPTKSQLRGIQRLVSRQRRLQRKGFKFITKTGQDTWEGRAIKSLKARSEMELLKKEGVPLRIIKELRKQSTVTGAEGGVYELDRKFGQYRLPTKPPMGYIREAKKPTLSQKALYKQESVIEPGTKKVLRAVTIMPILGVGRGVTSLYKTVVPKVIGGYGYKETAKNLIAMAKNPKQTIQTVTQQFIKDPTGTVAEFYSFGKGIGLTSKAIKHSPVGRTIAEERFIRLQPKETQPSIRAILKSTKAQEKINPFGTKKAKPQFMDVKALESFEGKALKNTLKDPKVDAYLFGSQVSRILAQNFKKALAKAKDVDLAVADAVAFGKAFIKNVPKQYQKNYVQKGSKLYKKVTSKEKASDPKGVQELKGKGKGWYDPIFDVKSKARLEGKVEKIFEFPKLGIKGLKVPGFKGQLPVVGKGYAGKMPVLSQVTGKTKKLLEGQLTVPLQKKLTIEGITMEGFGQQTTRKGLGTIQVLLEKQVRRQKDPSALVKNLELQVIGLKKKPGVLAKRKLKTIQNALKILKSPQFSKLLEKAVPGLTKEFPLISKINKAKLKQAQAQSKSIKILAETQAKLNKLKTKKKPTKPEQDLISRMQRTIKETKKKLAEKPPKQPSKMPKAKKPSKQPSKLPKAKKPSKLPFIKPFRPSTLPVRHGRGSRLPTAKPSKQPYIPISDLPKITTPSPPSKPPTRRPSKQPRPKGSSIPGLTTRLRLIKTPPPTRRKTLPPPPRRKYKLTPRRKARAKKPTYTFYTPTIIRPGKMPTKKKLRFFTGLELR